MVFHFLSRGDNFPLSHQQQQHNAQNTFALSLEKPVLSLVVGGVCPVWCCFALSFTLSLTLTHFLVTFSCAATVRAGRPVPWGGWKSSKRKATCWRNLEFLSQIKSVACSIRSQTGARIKSSFFLAGRVVVVCRVECF